MPRRHLDFHGNFNVLLNSNKLHCFLLFKLVALLVLINVAISCPMTCQCFAKTGLVQCHFLSLQEIPGEIPQWVQNLSVIGNNITVLRPAAFWNNGTCLGNLTTLILRNNSIQAIEALAFQDLPNLNTLDLSLNLLNSVSDDAFLGHTELQVLKLNHALQGPAQTLLIHSQWINNLRHLRRLEMAGNALQSFPSMVLSLENLQELNIRNNAINKIDDDTISTLYSQRTLKIYLSPNPIVCDCKIIKMYHWLRNSSQALDANNLKCSAPSNFNGTEVTSLKRDDLKCKNEDLETASYVFFGIVLALIGVIFLMVLYLNRRGIKRWLNNFREACRDQMEGYHYRYEQDSDPRRSNVATGI
ncbi:trophoblast glycoprotein-like [Rhinophrynus dorsalis]